MNAQYRDRSVRANRIRRSSVRMAFLSSAMMAYPVVPLASAGEANPSHEVAQPANLDSTPVLKSVGIRFVRDQAQSSHLVKSSPVFSGIQNPRSEAVVGLALQTPQVDTKAASVSPGLSKVIVNSFGSSPTIKMPPMVACSEQKLDFPTSPETGTVKMEMASVCKSLETLEPPTTKLVISNAKPIESKKASDAESKTISEPFVSMPTPSLLPTLAAVDPTPEATPALDPTPELAPATSESTAMIAASIPSESKVGSLSQTSADQSANIAHSTDGSFSNPTMAELETTEPRRVPIAASMKSPLLAGKKLIEEGSRAANVVRIPSMTLSSTNSGIPELPPPTIIASAKIAMPKIESEPQRVNEQSPDASSLAKSSSVVASKAPAALVPPSELSERSEEESSRSLSRVELNGTKALEKANVPSQTTAVHQPVREATRMEPTVVAIPASTKLIPNKQEVLSVESTPSHIQDTVPQGNESVPTSIHVELVHRDIQNLKVSGTVDKVEVDDETICKAIVSDARGIMLLGIGQGKTKVKVWLTAGVSAVPQLQEIDVSVRETWVATSQEHETTFAEATQSIAELFPTARIALRSAANGTLTIFGRADSEDQAKQIASLVRKMFLVPVQDRIATTTPK